jgi:hypothetical protein
MEAICMLNLLHAVQHGDLPYVVPEQRAQLDLSDRYHNNACMHERPFDKRRAVAPHSCVRLDLW